MILPANRKRTKRSYLFWKIASVQFSLLIAVALLQAGVVAYFWRNYSFETLQLINWNLAANFAELLQPHLAEPIDHESLNKKLYELSKARPDVHIFLLDSSGQARIHFSDLRPEGDFFAADLNAIRRFLSPDPDKKLPVLGRFRGVDEGHLFSAAPVQLGAEKGYVYITLNKQLALIGAEILGESYVLRISIFAFAVCFFGISLVGTLFFFLLTRRLREIVAGIRRFETGDMATPLEISGEDEISDVARTFNTMAETIRRNVGELENRDRLRRELIANISHDLRSPLSSLTLGLETFRGEMESEISPKKAGLLSAMIRGAEQLTHLVGELFELSKLEAKEASPVKDFFPVEQLIEEVQERFLPSAERRNIQIRAELENNLHLAYADRNMIERVLNNLVGNAIDFTPASGLVTLSASAGASGTLRIEVRDTGVGIAQEDLANLFEPFYRAKSKRVGAGSSTGLGLAIVKRALQLHQKDICVESTEGRGTVFTFELEAAPETDAY